MRYCYDFFSFRRAAQYFFIRRDTALLAAGDIFWRCVVGAGAVNSFAAARSARPPLEAIARVSRLRVARSGNVLSRSASSACSSFQRDSAPRRASARIEDGCLAMAKDNTRILWRVQCAPRMLDVDEAVRSHWPYHELRGSGLVFSVASRTYASRRSK